jgi:hypothetical protein
MAGPLSRPQVANHPECGPTLGRAVL